MQSSSGRTSTSNSQTLPGRTRFSRHEAGRTWRERPKQGHAIVKQETGKENRHSGRKVCIFSLCHFQTLPYQSLTNLNPCRNNGRSLCIKWHEMSQEKFLQHAELMNQVNEDFQMLQDQSDSRPRLRALNMSKKCMSTVTSILFNKDGSLSNKIKKDVDMSNHGYINFSNKSCSLARNDKQWQVPIHHHNKCKSCVPCDVTLIYVSF